MRALVFGAGKAEGAPRRRFGQWGEARVGKGARLGGEME